MKIIVDVEFIVLPETSKALTLMGFVPRKGDIISAKGSDNSIVILEDQIIGDGVLYVDFIDIYTDNKTINVCCNLDGA